MPHLPLNGDESVEELLEAFPQAQSWLSARGVLCVQCGQAYWGPLNELCAARRLDRAQTAALVRDLNDFLQAEPEAKV